jgi:uracil-DNA glycosylase family 4
MARAENSQDGRLRRERLLARLEFIERLGVRGISRAALAEKASLPPVRPENAGSPDATPYQPAAQASLFESQAAKNSSLDLDPQSRQQELDRIRAEIGDCRRCRLSEKRTRIVFGEGHPAARLVFAGEGPGHDEDVTGRPFVGRAGQLLDKIIAAMGFRREDCYICNVVKCRPPENRTPQDDEMRTCGQFLARQLQIIRPRVVVALGATAARYLLNTTQAMGKIRGRFFPYEDFARLMPTFHPAYLLRNPAAKKDVWEDMKQVMAYLKENP